MFTLLRLLSAALLVGALVPFAMPHLFRAADWEPPVDPQSRVLAYSHAVKRVVVTLALAVVCVFIFLVAMIEGGEVWGWFLLIGLFVALILPLVLEVFLVRVAWDDANIYTQSPWRRPDDSALGRSIV